MQRGSLYWSRDAGGGEGVPPPSGVSPPARAGLAAAAGMGGGTGMPMAGRDRRRCPMSPLQVTAPGLGGTGCPWPWGVLS